MRIIAGSFARRRITAPNGDGTRPTTDRVREALFQHLVSAWLDGGFHGLRVLDLYAGSGALALEALSRGASQALLIESAAHAASVANQNIRALAVGDRARVMQRTLPQAIDGLGGPFDLVFADPPYAERPAPGLLDRLLRRELVASDALFIYEHDARAEPDVVPGWEAPRTRRWGDTAVSIYRRADRDSVLTV